MASSVRVLFLLITGRRQDFRSGLGSLQSTSQARIDATKGSFLSCHLYLNFFDRIVQSFLDLGRIREWPSLGRAMVVADGIDSESQIATIEMRHRLINRRSQSSLAELSGADETHCGERHRG